MSPGQIDRELQHHEELYAGHAQELFDKPAVRAFRAHLVGHILRRTGAGTGARVLSIGCGIGDTELLLARSVGHVTGIDLSPAGIREARERAARQGVANAAFVEGDFDRAPLEGPFDLALAIFFLHHLSDAALAEFPKRLRRLLAPGARFYSLDPSRHRLAGVVGKLVVPGLMRRYQTPDERELAPAEVRRAFENAGFAAEVRFYDFLSTPLAGLLPGAGMLYRAARAADEVLVRTPGVRAVASNFEVVARNG